MSVPSSPSSAVQQQRQEEQDDDITKEMGSMPLLPMTTSRTLVHCRNLPMEANDIFICSYPKSGTTWTQHIVLSLLLCHNRSNHIEDVPSYEHVSDYAPFYDIAPHWNGNDDGTLIPRIRQNHKKLGRRVFNTHLRWNMLPQSTEPKFIYLIRSPHEVCRSYYCHLSHQVEGNYDKSFDQFVSDWINGDVIPYGSWISHLRSFLPPLFSSSYDNLLLISYQEMKTDLAEVVIRLSSFLQLDVTEHQIVNELLPTFTFEDMKANLVKFQPKSVSWKNNFSFLRQGGTTTKKEEQDHHNKTSICKWLAENQLELNIQEAADLFGNKNNSDASKQTMEKLLAVVTDS